MKANWDIDRNLAKCEIQIKAAWHGRAKTVIYYSKI